MLTKYENSFAKKAIRRKKLYLALSIVSTIIGSLLAIFYAWKAYAQPDFNIGIHFVITVLILLNARQNLRQYHFAKILETANQCVTASNTHA